MLELKGLTKRYGEFTALDHLDAEFEAGIYGLLGPNGAGKTTLLNLIADNLKRSEGEILYNGQEIRGLGKAYRKRIGYTPQVQGMYEDFTARDFLRYVGMLKGMRVRECRRQTEELLEVVHLSHEAHRRLGSFSGGMRQRTLIAAALLDAPEILILDEPTVGLDPAERIRLRDFIASLGKEHTVLLTTHMLADVETIADRILILSHGRKLHFDTAERLIGELRVPVAEELGLPEDRVTLEEIYLWVAGEGVSAAG